ncbi:hypothetical protein MVEN_01692500 [Mycena venus]|uniref:Uncharacterized protein n=1 Tax=Mycena venus TaxID=2733690 RepID=A0A8H6XPK0_9AGAR|nr:hypothetical protein MVEN_01692500 [Mycena venus]
MGISLSTQWVPSWQTACAQKFNCTSDGLVNINGGPLQSLVCPADGSIPTEVWGITAKACNQQCGPGALRQSVDFSASAITLTTWLLPWIALIAQLPFEAHGWMNILSGCLAVGSPALATYSLTLTALNRWYISRQFQKLKDMARNLKDARPEYGYMVERVDSAAFILQEVQQCPMRANQRDGALASLIVFGDPGLQDFWRFAAKDLKNTRRGFTYSFLAQVIMAFLAYLVSFIAAVHDSLGSPDVGLQFASSTVWSWMFPIVFGYIRVGSQAEAGCIKEALTDHKIIPQPEATGGGYLHQAGLCPSAELHFPLNSGDQDDSHDKQTATVSRKPQSARPSLTWLGFDVRGDEKREGPIFNYSRIFTWFAFAEHVRGGFEKSIQSLQKAGAEIPSTSEEATIICGFTQQKDLTAYTAWQELPAPAIQNILAAAFVALVVQWGTTGAAIFVAYSTPAVGLGCRSGSYLIYGVAATISWLLLVISSIASHAFMQRLEEDPHREDIATKILGGLAVGTRLTGKAIAICNASWLIASSVMEDIGTFQTCWCQTDAFQYHDNGWTPVFKSASDMRSAAQGIWLGGFLWSIAVCLFAAAIFTYDPRS